MPVYTFHCLIRDGAATSFVFQELEDEAAARRHTAELFRSWTTCVRIEIDCDGCEPFVVARTDSQADAAGRSRSPDLRCSDARSTGSQA